MSIKENVDFVKNELNSEEKFFESVVKAEGFYKNNKKYIILIVVLLILGSIGFKLNSYFYQQDLISSNKAFNILLKNSNNQEAITVLKESNKALYDMFLLQEALKAEDTSSLKKLQKSNNNFVSDIAQYQLASIEGKLINLSTYALGDKSILKDLAILQEVYILINELKYKEAKLKLQSVSQDNRQIKSISDTLNHYLISKD